MHSFDCALYPKALHETLKLLLRGDHRGNLLHIIPHEIVAALRIGNIPFRGQRLRAAVHQA